MCRRAVSWLHRLAWLRATFDGEYIGDLTTVDLCRVKLVSGRDSFISIEFSIDERKRYVTDCLFRNELGNGDHRARTSERNW